MYHGNSPFLSLEALNTKLEHLKATNPLVEISFLEAETSDPNKIVDEILSQSLFSSTRIFILKRIYRNKKKELFLEKILNLIEQNTSKDIVLFWEDQKIKSNTKYYKFFLKGNNIEEQDALNKRTFIPWAKARIAKSELKIEANALKELSERTNYDPERLNMEIEKFRLNDEKKSISIDDVESLTTDTLERDIWSLIDAINESDTVKSMNILENLNKQSVDPNYIISMLARNLRLITLTKFLLEKDSSSREIASALKVPPFLVPNLIKGAKKYSNERLVTIFTKLSNLDFQIKTGQIDGVLGLTLICPYL